MKDNTRQWRKSSYSGTGANCVEVRTDASTVAVRDSKHVAGPQLTFAGQAWSAFLAGIKRGELSL